jgi:hypothetical protein
MTKLEELKAAVSIARNNLKEANAEFNKSYRDCNKAYAAYEAELKKQKGE